ncbi:hypothetical protein C2845_PM09G21230 [Panicum miliaceum]|uniref:RNase H type-1 domain-containing protein n=1 Tax=Panicum miliaceum TaxID=4540 RepID=A0A3L6S3M2_PANMI|nr:hypothetical protein C2845_PM09G21230 [Panicum miliaceum]
MRSAEDLAYIIQKQSFELLKLEVHREMVCARKRWRRPSAGFLKINIDGSFIESTSSGGWDFVIRDDNMDVTHAGAGSCQYLMDAFDAEILLVSMVWRKP